MYCAVYKSPKKRETYLYLAAKDQFSRVPQALLEALGRPLPVLHLELHPGRRLAQADVREVLRHLREQGWYLQLPPRRDRESSH